MSEFENTGLASTDLTSRYYMANQISSPPSAEYCAR
jgi:hypothetical protein